MVARAADVVVDLDGVVREPTEPLVRAVDSALSHGDGVFETTLLRGGRPCLQAAHLTRLERSAAIVGLPRPDRARWRAAVDIAADRWGGAARDATGNDVGTDGVLRLVYGRGASFVMVSAVPPRAVTARRDGVAAVTLNPGPRGALTGAKSLSYALNVAALREATRRGADDAVYVGDDGVVLEGPRSSVLIAEGETLLSPPPALPILAGTTVAAVFEIAPRSVYRQLTVTDLIAAQGVWLLSSVTLCARVHTLDGVALNPAPRADELTRLVDRAVSR
ncbi:MAG: aminodeoxychorismate lyase [Mycobacterium sp.]